MKNVYEKIKKQSFLLLFLIICLIIPAHAYAGQKQVIRVGCIDTEKFSKKQDDGSVTGYCVDYLNEISKYSDFDYEYIFGTWSEIRTMLKNGKIDLMYTNKNDTENFDYSEQQFVITLSAIYARADDDNFYYDDFKRLDGSKIGILKNSFHKKYFKKYAQNKGFSYTQIMYDSQEELDEALQNGDVDAIAADSVSLKDDMKCVGTFGTEATYLAVNKGNSLIDDINYAMNEITSQEYEFANDLFIKYFRNESDEKSPGFTREECEFIKKCPRLKIALNSNISPIAYTDKSTGKTVGITPAIL